MENEPREATERLRLRQRYQAAIQLVWRQPDNCPICDSTAWNIGDLVDAPLRTVVPDIMDLAPKQVYVYVPVSCLYCGYTIFFHSGILDVRTDETVKAVPPLRIKDPS
jgi:predicted nucleic-acid-binding Zn-ribbon protein